MDELTLAALESDYRIYKITSEMDKELPADDLAADNWTPHKITLAELLFKIA